MTAIHALASVSSRQLQSFGIPAHLVLKRFDLGNGTELLQVRVTPELALDLLTHRNTANRTIKPSAVQRYAHDIASNTWVDGLVDPLMMCESGGVMNGQHRLRSVVDSGTPVVMFFQVGCPRSWMIAIDGGLKRSQADVERLTYGKNVDHERAGKFKRFLTAMPLGQKKYARVLVDKFLAGESLSQFGSRRA